MDVMLAEKKKKACLVLRYLCNVPASVKLPCFSYSVLA